MKHKKKVNIDELTVKMAEPKDIAALTALTFKAHKEAEMALHSADFTKITQVLTSAVLEGVPLVYKDDSNKIIGCMIMRYQDPNWFTTDKVLVSFFLYVEPEYRGQGIAQKLLEAAKEFKETVTDVPIIIGLMGTEESLERKGKLVESAGFDKYSDAYIIGDL